MEWYLGHDATQEENNGNGNTARVAEPPRLTDEELQTSVERLTQQRKGGGMITASARDFNDWKRKHKVAPETKVHRKYSALTIEGRVQALMVENYGGWISVQERQAFLRPLLPSRLFGGQAFLPLVRSAIDQRVKRSSRDGRGGHEK